MVLKIFYFISICVATKEDLYGRDMYGRWNKKSLKLFSTIDAAKLSDSLWMNSLGCYQVGTHKGK